MRFLTQYSPDQPAQRSAEPRDAGRMGAFMKQSVEAGVLVRHRHGDVERSQRHADDAVERLV